MTGFDIFFILLLLGGLALGFFQGTIKLIVAIIAFYLGIVLASLYFSMFGNFLRSKFNSTAEVGQIVAFALILLISFLVLLAAGFYTFRYAKAPPSLDFIDKIAGTLLGLLLGALFIGMLATMLRYLFIYHDVAKTANLPIVASLQGGVRASRLLGYFSDYILPLIYNAVRPVLPEQANFIFQAR